METESREPVSLVIVAAMALVAVALTSCRRPFVAFVLALPSPSPSRRPVVLPSHRPCVDHWHPEPALFTS
jgi:hypothetical protein